MEDFSTALLLERFSKHLEKLNKHLENLKNLDASLERRYPLPRVTPTSLLDLPFEIRLQIYRYCIPRKHVIEVRHPRFPIEWPFEGDDNILDFEDDILDFEDDTLDFEGDYWNPNKNKNSLLLLSKQISEECLDILYGENIFKLYLNREGEVYLRKNFTEVNRRRMRYLLLIAQPMGVSYQPGRIPDNVLWASILPSLRLLRIVAEQPIRPPGYFGAPTLEQEMDCWVKWIRPVLECFGQHLTTGTTVQVDDDGRKETSELVKKYLPDGYRKVQCRLAGDLIFRRGQFSIESGYWDDYDDGPTNSRDV